MVLTCRGFGASFSHILLRILGLSGSNTITWSWVCDLLKQTCRLGLGTKGEGPAGSGVQRDCQAPPVAQPPSRGHRHPPLTPGCTGYSGQSLTNSKLVWVFTPHLH